MQYWKYWKFQGCKLQKLKYEKKYLNMHKEIIFLIKIRDKSVKCSIKENKTILNG